VIFEFRAATIVTDATSFSDILVSKFFHSSTFHYTQINKFINIVMNIVMNKNCNESMNIQSEEKYKKNY